MIGWKACRDGVLVKLKVPAEAKRSHAFGRKCRAEFVDVLEVFNGVEGVSDWNPEVTYRAGQRVHCDSFDEDWTLECTGGIHFFITRIEAEKYFA